MDCRTASHHIEDFLDGVLDEAERGGFQQHMEACPDCRGRLARERVFRDALESMPVAIPDPDFAARAFECAANAHQRRPRFNNSVLMRLAASIVVIIALSFLFKDAWRPDRSEWPEAFVRLNQPEEISLVFYSNQDLDGVTLRLEPPEGVELVGFENQREVVWQTDLVQGRNLLVLPVIIRDQGGGSLIAEIRHGKQNKKFGLRIKVLRPDSSRPGAGKFEGSITSLNILI